jgi:hypothetical protein
MNVLVSEYKCSETMCFEADYPAEGACDYDGDEYTYYQVGIIPIRNSLAAIVNKTN